MQINIPNYKTINISNILLDYNGTIAHSGEIIKGVKESLTLLGNDFNIYVLTGDTFGTAKAKLIEYPVELIITKSKEDKLEVLNRIGKENSVAIGNGSIDSEMLKEAALSICILGNEGLSIKAFKNSDILVKDIADAFKLLLEPNRIIATLRE